MDDLIKEIVQGEDFRNQQRGSARNYHKWRVGLNRLRGRPFRHVVTAADKLRPRVDFLNPAKWEVGQTITLPALPVFVSKVLLEQDDGQQKLVTTVGHGGANCPAWAAWRAAGEPDDGKPRYEWWMNAVDLDHPEDGNLVVKLATEWRGPMVQGGGGTLAAPGLLHHFRGTNKDDNIVGAPTIEALGSAIFDEGEGELRGRTILIYRRGQKFRGKDSTRLDLSVKGGPIQIASEEDSPTFDASLVTPPVDLLSLASSFPGYASDGKHRTKDAADFAALDRGQRGDFYFLNQNQQGPVAAKKVVTGKKAEEPKSEKKAEPAKKSGLKSRKKDKTPKVGDTVFFEEDGVKIYGEYLGVSDDEHAVKVSVEAQKDPAAVKKVEEFLEAAGDDEVLVDKVSL